MPIGKDEWDAGRTYETVEAKILTFLRKNRNKGLTLTEIFQGLGYKVTIGSWGIIGAFIGAYEVQNALENLVNEKTVKARVIRNAVGEETYYMAT